MTIDGKTTFLKQGYTMDIVRAVIQVWGESWLQCMEFAAAHQGADILSTAKKIFDFVAQNISYKEDPTGKQWVKTPGRLLADGEGDCKSFSIFIASCLNCLGIDCVLRFASYDGTKEYTHVYPVALDENGNEVIIDVVVRSQQAIITQHTGAQIKSILFL